MINILRKYNNLRIVKLINRKIVQVIFFVIKLVHL